MVKTVKKDIEDELKVCTRITLDDTIITNQIKRLIISVFKIFAPLA